MEDIANFIYDATPEERRQIMLICEIANSLSYPSDDANIKTILKFSYFFNEELFTYGPAMIPNYVTSLDLGGHFEYEIEPGSIPDSVTHLNLGNRFNHKLYPGIIPDSVTHLILGRSYNRKIKPDIIPNSVTHLTMRYYFVTSDMQISVPDYVTHFSFRQEITFQKNNIIFPNTIQEIKRNDTIYKVGTPEFDELFTVYQKPVKGAMDN